jgi:hypothetical protein
MKSHKYSYWEDRSFDLGRAEGALTCVPGSYRYYIAGAHQAHVPATRFENLTCEREAADRHSYFLCSTVTDRALLPSLTHTQPVIAKFSFSRRKNCTISLSFFNKHHDQTPKILKAYAGTVTSTKVWLQLGNVAVHATGT